MAVSHVKSITIPDGGDTAVVGPSDWNSAHVEYYSISGNTTGVSTVSGTNIILQVSGQMYFSVTSNTLVLYNGIFLSRFIWPRNNFTAISVGANNSLSFFPFSVVHNVVFSRLNWYGSVSAATAGNNSSAFIDHTYRFGIYTANARTLNTVMSTTGAFSSTWSSNATGSVAGMREFQLTVAQTTLTPGLYYMGVQISTTNTATGGAATTALTHAITYYGGNQIGSANNVSPLGVATATSSGFMFGMGIYSTTVSSIPPAVSMSAIAGTGTNVQRANLAFALKNEN